MKKTVDYEINWSDYSSKSVLDLDDCHIFKFTLTDYNKIKNQYRDVLSIDEIDKSYRFKQKDDTKRYIIGKYFTRILLANRLAIEPSEIIFSETKNKKPTISNTNFNISHSGNLILIALSNVEVGIDVEFINPHFAYESLLTHCFRPSELLYINNFYDFYTFWTKKEAIIKATGEGLVDNLHEIDCSTNLVVRLNKKYQITTAYIDENYVYSLANTDNFNKIQYWNYVFFKNHSNK